MPLIHLILFTFYFFHAASGVAGFAEFCSESTDLDGSDSTGYDPDDYTKINIGAFLSPKFDSNQCSSLFAQKSNFQWNRVDHLLKLPGPSPFTVDHRLRANVTFWVQIYTQISNHEAVIHDSKYVDRVYEILRWDPDTEDETELFKRSKERWKKALLSVHQKTTRKTPVELQWAPDEVKVIELFQTIEEPQKFLKATTRKRLRVQVGQRENFLAGLQISGKFLEKMEDVFQREGLPMELTRLPFVESCFNVHARSKVGASGIWQFMPGTGRLFLKIDDIVDERNDPVRATEAAAKLLKFNYEILKSWPLAVTAYNHGSYGIARAVKKVGSNELEELVKTYRSRSFGFASSNFFTELLAAVEIERNAENYFGKIARHAPPLFVTYTLSDFIDIRDLTKYLEVELEQVRELNPGLRDWVFEGRRFLPGGFAIRLPIPKDLLAHEAHEKYSSAYQAIPLNLKKAQQLRTRLPGRLR